MSALIQSGDASPFQEMLPEGAQVTARLPKSGLITQRRQVRLVPQGPRNLGTAGAGAASQQVSFLLSDQQGWIDPSTVRINYFVQVANSGTPVPDDGHVFSLCQVTLNGQVLDNITNAMKVTNIEARMGGSQQFYKTAGSLMGMELLNPDLVSTVVAGAYSTSVSQSSGWGWVTQHVADLNARCTAGAKASTGGYAGSPRSIPLGLISGVFRTKKYIPLSVLGDMVITLVTGSDADVVFNAANNAGLGTYSIAGLSLEYDQVVPHPSLAAVVAAAASEEGPGITIPFESTTMSQAGIITTSASALKESSVVVQRATNYLLRSSLVQVPSARISSANYPEQSCFSKAGTWSVQWRVGPLTYPQLPPEGDSALLAMSLAAWGAGITPENGSCTNRMLWGNSTDPSTVGTAAIYADSVCSTARYAYADTFIPSYGFQTVKGTEPLAVDGISISGAGGSNITVAVTSAPPADYIPYVELVALRFISAKGNQVAVSAG